MSKAELHPLLPVIVSPSPPPQIGIFWKTRGAVVAIVLILLMNTIHKIHRK